MDHHHRHELQGRDCNDVETRIADRRAWSHAPYSSSPHSPLRRALVWSRRAAQTLSIARKSAATESGRPDTHFSPVRSLESAVNDSVFSAPPINCFAANSSGVRSPSELCGRSVLYSTRQASMTSPCLRHGHEPVLVQALVAELAVEALDVGVLVRLAGPDERQAARRAGTPRHRAPGLRTPGRDRR